MAKAGKIKASDVFNIYLTAVKVGLTVLNFIQECLKFFSYNFLNENLYLGNLNSALHNFSYAAQYYK